MRRTRHNTGWIRMMGLLGLILAGFACADSTFDDDGEGGFRLTPEAESTMPLPSLDALPPGVPIVYAGIFVDKVYELSLVSRTFSADGYVWLEWPAAVQDQMEAEGISPIELIRISNRIEIWDSTFEPVTAEARELSAGRYYQRYRFSSRFYDDEIEFHRDPFDEVNLPIIIEIEPPAMSDKYSGVVLLPHHQANGFMGQAGTLSGYQLEKSTFRPYLHGYPSRFGSWYTPTFSQVRLEMIYQADYWSAFLTWVFPLLIIMAVVLLAPSVAGALGDVRVAIPSTALLTLIFLQQAYHDELPPLPYLTFLDELFAASYAIALGLFSLFTWGTNAYANAAPEDRSAVSARIDRTDLIFQTLAITFFLGVAITAWMRS